MLVHTKDRCKVPSAIFHLWLTEARHTEHADGGAAYNLRVRNMGEVARAARDPEGHEGPSQKGVWALHDGNKRGGTKMMRKVIGYPIFS